MPLLLHLDFRNADGSLAVGGWWFLILSVGWIVWGLAAEVRPRWVLRPLALVGLRLERYPARGWIVITVRAIGVLSLVVGIIVSILVLRATPGRLY